VCASALLVVGCSGSSGGGSDGGGAGGVARLAWDEPTTNADGTPLLDLTGYRIYYARGTTVTRETATRLDLPGGSNFDVTGLAPGSYGFVVCDVDFPGNMSAWSPSLQLQVP
jgi:hypothetical protein